MQPKSDSPLSSKEQGRHLFRERTKHRLFRRFPSGAPLWALIHVPNICLDLEDAVARIGVGAEEFGRALSLA